MPRPYAKHQEALRTLSDFKGGLNTEAPDDMIAENQMSVMVNLETDEGSGLLRTSMGTRRLCSLPEGAGIWAFFFDYINRMLVAFGEDGEAYATDDFEEWQDLGALTGAGYPSLAAWEDGFLAASGGRLQYVRRVNAEYLEYLKTVKGVEDPPYKIGDYVMHEIEDSPATCKGVIVRSGRVIVFDDSDTLYYSGVGDEEYWEQDPNDPSTSLFLQIGYKAGGKVVGMVPAVTDVLVIKDTGMVYRLRGEYPDWSVAELGRSVKSKGPSSFCDTGTGALVLGPDGLYAVSPTQAYGDMRPESLGAQVASELRALPAATRLRYLAPLRQVWMISGCERVLVLDLATGGFFVRVFNADVKDALAAGGRVYLARPDAIDVLEDDGSFEDCGRPLAFAGAARTDFGRRQLLVKDCALCVTPLKAFDERPRASAQVGRIALPFPGRRPVPAGPPRRDVAPGRDGLERRPPGLADGEGARLFMNPSKISPGASLTLRSRAASRGPRIPVRIHGEGTAFMLNYLSYARAEV